LRFEHTQRANAADEEFGVPREAVWRQMKKVLLAP
jgi:hypothetical protein